MAANKHARLKRIKERRTLKLDYIDRYFTESEYTYESPRAMPDPLRRRCVYPS